MSDFDYEKFYDLMRKSNTPGVDVPELRDTYDLVMEPDAYEELREQLLESLTPELVMYAGYFYMVSDIRHDASEVSMCVPVRRTLIRFEPRHREMNGFQPPADAPTLYLVLRNGHSPTEATWQLIIEDTEGKRCKLTRLPAYAIGDDHEVDAMGQLLADCGDAADAVMRTMRNLEQLLLVTRLYG